VLRNGRDLRIVGVLLLILVGAGLADAAGTPVLAVPPLPSSFYGTVKVNGANVPEGTQVTAWVDGVRYAYTTVLIYQGDTVYALDVPGDEQETPETIEGGVQGDVIVFRVGGVPADQIATWQTGTNVNLDLTLRAGTTTFLPLVSK